MYHIFSHPITLRLADKVYLYVSYDSPNKERLFPQTTSVDLLIFVMETRSVFFEVRTEFLNIIYMNLHACPEWDFSLQEKCWSGQKPCELGTRINDTYQIYILSTLKTLLCQYD
jgi:hypothetical protein